MTMQALQEMWIKRADGILSEGITSDPGESIQCAVSMITAFYGPESAQMKIFRMTLDNIGKQKDGVKHSLRMNALGTIRNIKAEISAGLTKKVRALIAGEVLSELIALSKETLCEHQNLEATKNIGAVLVAAAFEDVLRRMGAEFASVTARPKLEMVINALKEAEVLKGGEPALAQGYLKFRNDSLHAD